MGHRILHVLDGTTPGDGAEVLGLIAPGQECRVVVLGHRSTGELLACAGLGENVTYLHSMGWCDPTGWRGVKRVIREYGPTHVHAWGVPAGVAVTMSGFKGERVVSLVDMPSSRHMQLVPFVHKGGLYVSVSPCHWTVSTTWLKRELHSHGIAADAVTLIRPAVNGHEEAVDVRAMREELGLMPGDGPVVLLGGDPPQGETMFAEAGMDPLKQGGRGGSRHDLGMWSAAVLQTIFPRIKTVVREDPRGRVDHGLERLFNKLPDDEVVVLAPRQWSWGKLMRVADVLLVTPDGPFAAGVILHAFAARVPVVGTPVDAVKEHVTDGVNGVVAAEVRVKAITAALERFLSDGSMRERVTEQGLADLARHEVGGMVRGFEGVYG